MSRRTSARRQSITGLMKRKRQYELYFEESEKLDHQALSAYINILKTMVEFESKAEAVSHPDGTDVRRAAEEILEEEFGVRRKG